MTSAAYAVWVLVLQTSAYISFFNLGLQTAIGRYVAYANEKRDAALRDAVFSTAFAAAANLLSHLAQYPALRRFDRCLGRMV
jgi:O-antigen/teichoic acid export membrane protein